MNDRYKRAWMNAEWHLQQIWRLCSQPYLGEDDRGREFREAVLECIRYDSGDADSDPALRALRTARGVDPLSVPPLRRGDG